MRTPLRSRTGTRDHRDETAYDVFLSPARPAADPTTTTTTTTTITGPESGVLKQTLLAQLNARVASDGAETTTMFVTDGSSAWGGKGLAREEGTQGQQLGRRYDGRHDRMFKSMKSIARPTAPRKGGASISAPQGGTRLCVPKQQRQDGHASCTKEGSRVAVLSSPPKSVKRPGVAEHAAATPSKKRRVMAGVQHDEGKDETGASRNPPSFSSVMDEAGSRGPRMQEDGTGEEDVDPRVAGKASSTRPRLGFAFCAEPSSRGIDNHGENMIRAVSRPGARLPEDKVVAQTTAAAAATTTTTRIDGSDRRAREQKRLDERRRVAALRMKTKSSIPRPGWT